LVAIAATQTLTFAADAANLPYLQDTVLYKELAHNCRSVDLIGWNHPAKRVLRKYQVQLDALELCNLSRYPIFHVIFKYDPMGNTNSFFAPFYKAMFTANGRNPMAFVEKSGNVIVMLSNDHGKLKTTFEQYSEE
jgi:hypothetical protein